MTGLHKIDGQKVTASTLFPDANCCPGVWNDDVRARATAWWALVMVRAYSGHKMPVISEWRSSGMSKLSSLSLCDVHRGKKQGYKSNVGFVFLAELPEKHMCRFQDEHSDQEKKATWDFPTYERKEKNTMIEKRKGKQQLISLSWTWNCM